MNEKSGHKTATSMNESANLKFYAGSSRTGYDSQTNKSFFSDMVKSETRLTYNTSVVRHAWGGQIRVIQKR